VRLHAWFTSAATAKNVRIKHTCCRSANQQTAGKAKLSFPRPLSSCLEERPWTSRQFFPWPRQLFLFALLTDFCKGFVDIRTATHMKNCLFPQIRQTLLKTANNSKCAVNLWLFNVEKNSFCGLRKISCRSQFCCPNCAECRQPKESDFGKFLSPTTFV